MSEISTRAALHLHPGRKSPKRHAYQKVSRGNYTNFAGTTVPPLTKEQWEKGMAVATQMKHLRAW